MNRRGFIRLLGIGAASAVVPKYFLPPIGGWRSDTIVNPYDDPNFIGNRVFTIGSYADYFSFSDLALQTSINPLLANLAMETSYRAALKCPT